MNKLFYFLFEIKIYCDKDFELLFNYLIFFIKFFFGDWGLGIGPNPQSPYILFNKY